MRTVKIIAAAALLATWGTASAVSLTLIADNTRSSSGTLSYSGLPEPVRQPQTLPARVAAPLVPAWQVANGVTGSTATWNWDGTTLAATGTFQSTSHLSSNPFASAVISDKTVNLTINTATMSTTATSYNCIEGNFLANVGANGCLNTGTAPISPMRALRCTTSAVTQPA